MSIFVQQDDAKSPFCQILKSRSISEIGVQMFACDPTFYRFQNNFYQHRVSVHSIIDFLGGDFGSPPPLIPTESVPPQW